MYAFEYDYYIITKYLTYNDDNINFFSNDH